MDELPGMPGEDKDLQQRLAEFVAIENRRRELEDELRRVCKERDEMESRLLKNFGDLGMQAARIGNLTVYLRREVRASPKDGDSDRLCDTLAEQGFGELVKRNVHPQRLSAFVRDYEQEGKLPDWLDKSVSIFEQYNIRTRKS